MIHWVLCTILLGDPISASLQDEPIRVPVGQRQLFLDNDCIARLQGLHSTMHQPVKRGAVIRPDAVSDGSRVQTYGSVPLWVPDEQVFKMVYMAFPMENHGEIGAALAISKDGLHWEKPDLGQGISVRGSTTNNRIFVDRKLHWGDNALWNVIYDANDPDPQRRFKGLLGAIGRTPVVSADAIHWTPLAGTAIPSHDTSTLTYDDQNHRFLAVLKTFNRFGRAAALSTSPDFRIWSTPSPSFSTDDLDQKMAREMIRNRIHDTRFTVPLFVDPEPKTDAGPTTGRIPTWRAECYAFSIFPYEGVYLGLPMVYYPTGEELPARNNSDGFHSIQLAMSRDLTTWNRLGDRGEFIGPSPIDKGLIGVFDRQELIPPSRPVLQGDELWFYYTGFKTRIPPYSRNPDGTPRDPASLSDEERDDLADGWSAICLAVLRRDGFVSLDAGSMPGTLLTKPFVLDAEKLCVNLDATEGEMTVEVVNNNQQTVCCSKEISGNHPRTEVSWKSGQLANLKGEPVRLRFTLTNSRLYSLWLE